MLLLEGRGGLEALQLPLLSDVLALVRVDCIERDLLHPLLVDTLWQAAVRLETVRHSLAFKLEELILIGRLLDLRCGCLPQLLRRQSVVRRHRN